METQDAPPQGVAQRWLRALLFEDWSLKLLALAITLGLWYGVTSQRAPATIRLIGVQLFFLRPEGVEIANEPRQEVEVTLQGRSNELNDLVMRNLVATVDISRYKLGERVVRLTPENVSMNLPEGVRIEKIEPRSIALRLEQRVEREVEVAPRLEGKLPEGFEVQNTFVAPPRVRVRGPESLVRALEKAPTETILLDGQTETLTLPQTAIDITDARIVTLDPAVAVRVEIVELRLERRLDGVPVRAARGDQQVRPARVNVLLRGGRSIVEKLRADNLEIVLEESPDGSLRPRLLLPQGMQGRVELISTTPSQFSIDK
jgi:hypothetical protein